MAIDVPVTEIQDKGLFPLAQALFCHGLLLPEHVPAIMQGAMEAGHESWEVVEVAGLIKPTRRGCEALVTRAFQSISGVELSRAQAVKLIERFWAEKFLRASSDLEQEHLLRQVEELFVALENPDGVLAKCMIYCDQLDWDPPDRPRTSDTIARALETVREWMNRGERSDAK